MTVVDRPKLIYVAQRHPRYTHQEFIRRWRQHAALGMSQARWRNVALYLHCDHVALPPSVPTIDCDGVAVVVYRSEQARQSHIADETARRTMKQDELDTFAQPVANTSLLLREEIERADSLAGFRLFVFWSSLSPDAGAAREPLTERWYRPVMNDPDIAFTRNHAAGRIGEWQCVAVDELTSKRADSLCAVASSLTELRAEGSDARMVLTYTVVLHDARTTLTP